MRLTLLRIGIASSLALGAVLGAAALPQPARAADPASLDGEVLVARSEYRTGLTGAQVDGECTLVVGESWTQTYEAAGTATGPYPGSFTMSGTLTSTVTRSDAPGTSISVIETWSGEFAIDSPAGAVQGTQTLSTANTSQSAVCFGFPLSWPASSLNAYLAYQATIRPASGGLYAASGSTHSWVDRAVECGLIDPNCTAGSGAGFEAVRADFTASTGVVQVVPSKAQCSKGGYADYGYATEKACKEGSKPPKGPGK
ncbi:MAG: hypothetical protein QOF68_47 [Gaiellales bacterium]|nr:hypothetical protein [Gaiellales bacterium]